MGLSIPLISRLGELQVLGWSVEVPISEIVTLLHPQNPIPNVEDLRSILSQGIAKFMQGFRSVRVRVHSMFLFFSGCPLYSD
jgi:hypothetical protein